MKCDLTCSKMSPQSDRTCIRCVICYKPCGKSDRDLSKDILVPLFLINAQRHFKRAHFTRDILDSGVNKSENWEHNDLVKFCSNCLLLAKEFNEVYHQLKYWEMKVNWNAERIAREMKFADKIPSRIKSFREGVTSEDYGQVIEFRSNFKDLFQKDKRSPSVYLRRLQIETEKKTDLSSLLMYSTFSNHILSTEQDLNSDEDVDAVRDKSSNNDVGTGVTVKNEVPPVPPEDLKPQVPTIPSLPKMVQTFDIVSAASTISALSLQEERQSDIGTATTLSPITDMAEELGEENWDFDVEMEAVVDNYDIKIPADNINIQAEGSSQTGYLDNNAQQAVEEQEVNHSNIVLEKTETKTTEVVPSTSEGSSESGAGIGQSRRLRNLHKCTICGLTFSNDKRLEAHMNSAHDDDESEPSSHSEMEEEYEEFLQKPTKKAKITEENRSIDNNFQSEESDGFTDSSSSQEDEDDSESDSGKGQPVIKKEKCQPVKRKRRAKSEIYKSHDASRTQALLKCPYCPKSYTNTTGYKRHIASKHNSNKNMKNRLLTADGITMSIQDWALKKGATFKCPEVGCQKLFMTEYDLGKHSKLHGTFHCQFCFDSKDFAADLALHELEKHSKKHDQVDPVKSREIFNCPRCPYKTQIKVNYLNHHLNKHLDGLEMDRTRCPICKASTSCTKNPAEAILIHYAFQHDFTGKDESKSFKCDQCPAYFLTNLQLDQHQIKIHAEGQNKFKCQDCEQSFKTRFMFQYHRKNAHKLTREKWQFVCKADVDCKREFETQVDLDRHVMLKHSGKTCFLVCPKCGKKVLGDAAFKGHMKSHQEKPSETSASYVCQECGKSFKQKTILDAHLLFHAGPEAWQFSCPVCHKKIATKQKLEEHQRTHTKEKPFVCQLCGDKYAHRHNLRNHMKSKHGVDETKRKVSVTENFASTRKGKKLKGQGENGA